jgi:hypothetical protein
MEFLRSRLAVDELGTCSAVLLARRAQTSWLRVGGEAIGRTTPSIFNLANLGNLLATSADDGEGGMLRVAIPALAWQLLSC